MEGEKGSVDFVERSLPGEKLSAVADATPTGDALLVTSDGAIQKLPIPSSDPNDPLNYTSWEKAGIIFSCCWFSIMSLALAGGLGAILVTFIVMYSAAGHSVNEVVWLTTFPSLFIGVGTYMTTAGDTSLSLTVMQETFSSCLWH